MNELGKRIHKLRLERGMTLVDLAGNQMTKGMLSMIENGRANPSMESLKFIARQLNCDPHYLLENHTSDELKYLFNQVEEAFHQNNDEQITNLTQGLFDQQLPTSFESARLLEIGGRTVVKNDQEQGEMLIERAVAIYEQLSLYSHCVAAKVHVAENRAKQGNYGDALRLLRSIQKKYHEKAAVIDTVVEVEANYVEVVLLFGVGDYKSGKNKLNHLIELSNRKRVFYKMDDIFRIAAFQSLIHNNENDYVYFIKKSEQFAVFSENDGSLAFTLLLQAHYHNQTSKNYEQVLFYLNEFTTLMKGEIGSDYYYLEKGKALLGIGQVEEALVELNQFEMPTTISYPLELSILYTADAYKAICLLQLGRVEEASICAARAATNIGPLPRTPYQEFINNTLDMVNKSLK